MLQTKKIPLLLFVICLFVGITACNKKKTDSKKESIEQQGKEYISAYVCPMHCEGSGSDSVGTCPVCGMDYEKNEDHQDDGHSHDHSDPNHSH